MKFPFVAFTLVVILHVFGIFLIMVCVLHVMVRSMRGDLGCCHHRCCLRRMPQGLLAGELSKHC